MRAATETTTRAPSFNGAASRRRRKVHQQNETTPTLPCASTGPPHEGGGRDVILDHALGGVLASTGPPHDGGGRFADDRTRGTMYGALQRGRLTKEAEGRLKCGHQDQAWPCFNGAASRRRWKEPPGHSRREWAALASTGPPPEGGGRRGMAYATYARPILASTGPPPGGGGRDVTRNRVLHTLDRLQRGRLTMEAEGSRRTP